MSKKKRDHAWSENGFEEWGGYMAAKKAKLEEQFRNTANKEFKESSKLFEGIAIFVNGYTDPTSDELKRLMMMHGGLYHHYMRPKITTHIIASNLPYSKIMLYRKSQNPIPICKPQWIIDSIAAGKVLNFQNYLLYSNSTNIQPQLAYKFNKKIEVDTSSVMHEQDIEQSKSEIINNETDTNNKNISKHNINDSSKHDTINNRQPTNTRTNHAQSTRDAEFLSAFYSNSRLHYIATMGTTFKDYVNELRDKSDGVFPGLERLMELKRARGPSTSADCESEPEDETICFTDSKMEPKRDSVIMHIDMDCFFVSVGIRKKPELRDLPVAVTHAKGNTFSANYDGKEEFGSLSEVASCSYAARKAGVKNGMFLGEALKLCPNLKTIPYDFEGYKEVSYILYDTVASYTLDIEAVSCDEMYADCTRILEASALSPLEFATIIRNEIKRKTDCPVSTGFGNNKLQARLATRKAKPDNQFYLSKQNAETYVRALDTRDLPGVGGTTTHKLRKMNVRTCEDLQKISLGVLQKEFGKKMGEQLHKMCRGLDDTKLNLEHIRKSVSAEVNYGIRFRNDDDAVNFLSKLSTEVCDRLTVVRAKGRCITLKLMVRAEDAPRETAKFMGHGPCNYITKSKNLIAAVDDVSIIKKEVISIWNQLHLTPEDMRGIGIQISRLEICKTKQNKGNLINFFSKSAKMQTNCDQMLSKDEKNRCDSNFTDKSKLDSSKVSLTAESSSGREHIFDAKVNLPSTESSNVHKDECVAIQTKSTSETKDKKLHNCKASETKVKDLSGKSSKKAIQRQTSQENFFRHTKPSSGRSSKYEVPRIQDIDMSVLIELPQDIRNEIFDEYKRNKRQQSQNKVSDDKKSSDVQDCSQIDPDVLSALMKNDLHPDVQRDVQIYCDMKREANKFDNKINLKETNENKDNEQPQGASSSSKANDSDKKSAKPIVNNSCINEVTSIPREDKKILHVRDQLYEKDDINKKADSTSCRSNYIEISHNDAAMDKADTFILQNLSILHNNENIDKHQEMLITLVNHLFALPLQQVPYNYSLKQIIK